MIRLPASVERRLQQLFPRARDREQFVAMAVEKMLAQEGSVLPEEALPQHIGGTLHLFTDGGSRGNPGQAAIGCILEDPSRGETLEEHGEVIGIETNNIAEYRALLEGMKMAQKYHPNRLVCHLDAELIVKQMRGEYRVKMPSLQEYVDEIRQTAAPIPSVEYVHIPRSDNYRADALVNKVLDAHPAPRYGDR